MANCALASSTELPPDSVQPDGYCSSRSRLTLCAFRLHFDAVCGELVPDTTILRRTPLLAGELKTKTS